MLSPNGWRQVSGRSWRDTSNFSEAVRLRESLRRLEGESWQLYLEELRRLDAPAVEELHADDWDTPVGQWLRSDAGHPLGPGCPSGSPIAGDDVGRHIYRWMIVLRGDPCAYCGRCPAGTVDHIVARRHPDRETHTWLNMAGSCAACNAAKGSGSLLEFLRLRALAAGRHPRTVARGGLPAAA